MKKLLAMMLCITMVLALAACGAEPAAPAAAPAAPAAAPAAPAAAPAAPAAPEAAATASGLPALTKDEIVVGAVFNVGAEGASEGFAYALYQGLEALKATGIKVLYATDIPESSECETAIENLIAQGCNVIYTLSFGYGEYTANMAEKYPNVYFNHYAGSIQKTNMATFFPKNFQSEYLCGIVAGAKTETNQIGYLCSFPIPECVRMVNAFTLGAQSVNPDVQVNVKWTNSWFDPAVESATAKELVNSGSDVIIAYLDSLNAAIGGAELGAYGFGYATSGIEKLPDNFLTNPACDWETFFQNDVQRVIDGTWVGADQWLGMAEGLVSLGEVYNSSEETLALVEAAKKGFLDGSLNIWEQELVDNQGTVQSPAGETPSDADLLSMMYFLKGVNGTVG